MWKKTHFVPQLGRTPFQFSLQGQAPSSRGKKRPILHAHLSPVWCWYANYCLLEEVVVTFARVKGWVNLIKKLKLALCVFLKRKQQQQQKKTCKALCFPSSAVLRFQLLVCKLPGNRRLRQLTSCSLSSIQ
jgi:hypothetical protein